MNRFLSIIKKEILILVRDIPGMFLIFIMPAVLILVISLAEKYADQYSNEAKTPVIIIDKSHSGFAREIEKNLKESGFFEIIKTNHGKSIGEKEAHRMIGEGKVQAGLLVQPGDTALQLLIDPSTQDLFHPSRIAAMKYIIQGTQSRQIVMNSISGMSGGNQFAMNNMANAAMKNMAPVETTYAQQHESLIKPTATQNNLPGYLVFAMFLIVIPVAVNIVNEKSYGFRVRFRTLPVTILKMFAAKEILFLIVCMCQFLLMFIVGILVFPGFTGYVNIHSPYGIFLLVLITFASALAATGFGLLIGSLAETMGQAGVFGPLIAVILAAISGAFIPSYMLPGFLQTISWASPMRWGIESYITVFFRHGGFLMILPEITLLILFFLLTLGISDAVTLRKK
ncbi:MAG: ABC transporter permease [Bacteroidota bacterium]|nr:ABC transporter permease [Bacteroidota bacterium]